jgi:enoyl-CoA hydratase
VLQELREHLDSIRRANCFHGVVVASNAHSFSTGADLEEVAALDGLAAREFARLGQALFKEIERFPSPTVAAIRGFCLGGGLDLALACQARVGAYGASFGHPGPALGLITGWGGTERLPRRVGRAEALRMLVTGERVPAAQALTLGLLDELVPSAELEEAAVRRVLERGRASKQST